MSALLVTNPRGNQIKRWTQAAKDCYFRGCRCSGCFFNDFFSNNYQKCQMKNTVLKNVEILGKPCISDQENII